MIDLLSYIYVFAWGILLGAATMLGIANKYYIKMMEYKEMYINLENIKKYVRG